MAIETGKVISASDINGQLTNLTSLADFITDSSTAPGFIKFHTNGSVEFWTKGSNGQYLVICDNGIAANNNGDGTVYTWIANVPNNT